MERSFSTAILVFLFLSIFALVVMTAPAAKAQSITVTLTPSSGPPGTQVIVNVSNYPADDSSFSLKFGSITEQSIYGIFGATSASGPFTVPVVASGIYTVTVTDPNAVSGAAPFTVTQGGSATTTATPKLGPSGTSTTGSSGSSGTIPTYIAVTPYSGVPSTSGFWSPLAIGVVAFVVVIACFATVVFVRRGRQGTVLVEDDSGYKPRSSVENTQPFNSKSAVQETSRYGYRSSTQQTSPYGYRSSSQQTSPYGYRSSTQQTSPYGYRSSTQQTSPYGYRSSVPPTRSTVTPQFNQTATNPLQTPARTKICKYCKREIREDQNVCPYCMKKQR